jgi:hypothetical protein
MAPHALGESLAWLASWRETRLTQRRKEREDKIRRVVRPAWGCEKREKGFRLGRLKESFLLFPTNFSYCFRELAGSRNARIIHLLPGEHQQSTCGGPEEHRGGASGALEVRGSFRLRSTRGWGHGTFGAMEVRGARLEAAEVHCQ